MSLISHTRMSMCVFMSVREREQGGREQLSYLLRCCKAWFLGFNYWSQVQMEKNMPGISVR